MQRTRSTFFESRIVKTISQAWLYKNFSKRKSINRLIDAFLRKENVNIICSMNVYLIFEFRRIRKKRERKFVVFRVMFCINKKCLVLTKNMIFIESQSVRNWKKNVIVIESINCRLLDNIDVRLQILCVTRYVVNNMILTLFFFWDACFHESKCFYTFCELRSIVTKLIRIKTWIYSLTKCRSTEKSRQMNVIHVCVSWF